VNALLREPLKQYDVLGEDFIMPYLFKDTDVAAQRLQILAEVFAPSTRSFLQEAATIAPQLALDLGCGPGYTTHLLAETTLATQTIGLDSSEYFVALATQSSTVHISFIHHDVTLVPFPTELNHLIFCRMLLTHLRDPQSTIEHWATQLCTHGLLFLEEVEWINTEFSLFRTYLDILTTLLAHQQNQLYIGPLPHKQQFNSTLKRRWSRVYRLSVSTAQAATMFSLNIRSWKQYPFIQQKYTIGMIDNLERELQALAVDSTALGDIEWGMRQIVYERI
jgi:trans-aconitate 2-methyltransferase